ncbi:inactive ubiquitin carboxyl-terminal hydrolase 54-like [Actinia tenebrosa]|uniref:Inactive ubiquitin carboxyl-terminal hydrolase 54-like n=1 Tax=Actinia tenebrosa TaxID=6105 RepID=A0A6P8J6B9_ACTTE|nr:inactive ubiquitin carboxyl-terminal hydrolase 54-like [Actinia tenebrosa]
MNREERLERTMSMAQNKGLLNNPGQNNCFLNSAVQVFWHLDVFRRSFREIKGHFCMGKSCIFCALQNIFKDFQYSNNDALPPDALRIAMANTFKDQRKFQMGDMDDAAECFETILSRMHFHLAMDETDDGCNAQHCITHQKFAMQIIEQTVCPCGEQSEPLPFFQTVHYVSASALCAKARRIEKFLGEEYNHTKHFGTLLRMTGEDTRDCASPECDENIRVQRSLLNCPEIVSVGLNWDSESPEADHIAEVLQCIGTTLKLPYLFHHVYNAHRASLNLVGIVTYYGKHYSTFVFHSKLKTWIYFDDARVQEIGPDWSVIQEKCRRCHYQPLLLLYANPNGTPVNTSTAPQEKVLINNGTFVRTPDSRPKSRRLSSEFFRYNGERVRPRKRHSSNCENNICRTDSESNMSTLKSEKRLSTSEGNDDTLKARDNHTSVHPTWLDDESGTLKANDSSDNQRSRRTDSKTIKDEKSPRSRRSKSCDTLDDGTLRKKPSLTRMNSTGSDVTETLKRKKRASIGKDKQKKTGLRRIGSAIIQAMKPATAITHIKTSRKKNKDRRPSDASTVSNGERGSMELSSNPDATITQQDLLRLYEQAQSDDYLWSPSHDSGIGSATGSVSSNDTNHGGSDEDLVEYSHTLYALRNGGHKPKSSSNRMNKSRTSEECEVLLQQGDNMVLQSQNAENSRDYKSALRFCAEAATSFRKATEISGMSSNNGKYAVIKKDQCQLKIRQLRQKIEAVSNVDNMPKLAKREDDEVLRQQRIRDEMILKQQQQNHAQYGTLRNQPTLHKVSPSSATLLHSRQDSSPKLDPRINQEYHSLKDPMSCTLPIKPKRVSSNHYSNKINPSRNECTQKIKPDSMCYSPTHYDDMTGRMMGLSIHQPTHINGYSPSEKFSFENPSTVQKNINVSRSYTSDSEATKPRPTERKISSSATIYLQPTRGDSYVVARRGGYDPMSYVSPEEEQPRQSKVYYAGASEFNVGKDTGLRSRSYGSMETPTSSHSSGRVPFDALPPSYRPSPPSYQSIQQARASLNNSNISPRKPWYHDNTSVHSEPLLESSAPANLRAVSARIIVDRPVCESCLQVPVGRQQRICAGCVQEHNRRHRQLQDGTDMLY